jgi:ligand-binding SRPBCC domain-containing protein
MNAYRLEREQWIPSAPDAVFPFFSEARNLERITPPWLGFRFITPHSIEMGVGQRIEYTIRIAGVPVRWRTLITQWDPPHGFVDVQERGPYALWEHAHTFRPLEDGVLMTDLVRYRLPFGPLGRAVHWLAVRAMLARIFDYRFERVRELFTGREGAAAPGRGEA